MSQDLQPSLRKRHLSMIAIAGVIGAGLFVGSGAAIGKAGPGVLLSYAAAGLLVVLVMRMLGEMSSANPDTGSFSAYAERAIGPWAGFAIGWLYWWFWVVVVGIEATAGAAIVHRWVPAVPQWTWALLLTIVLTLTNLYSVRSFGEFEFWFAGIKVAAITVFLAVGVLAIGGLLPGFDSPGLTNLTGHGGFFPQGTGPVFAAMLVVVFSFFGAEIATVAAGESANPVQAVRAAVKSVVWRILVFYIGSIAVVVTLLPWDDADVAKSPYVAVLDTLGLPAAAVVMDVVVLTSVLSCLNSGLFTASRMVFSLSRRGEAPAVMGRVSRRGVPTAAVLASTVVGFATVALNYLSPDTVFLFLVNSSGAVAVFVWLAIAVSQLRMRKHLEERTPEQLTLRMWGYPYLTWAAIVGMVALLVGMLFDADARSQLLLSLLVAAVVVAVGVVRGRRGAPRAAEVAETR
ncbi:gamma-aminobutyrate:proton symporter (AAT family) [Lentzea atacamensis]|uniref:Gamma-aminobutyrate:proton symporter (AAT family) n=2 Tax=Lentzea TaxID=165301 RepID=A0A316I3B7_9PSEU|nr:amino acid permease [Lentzea atacamensis]PWK84933.1 gamma-aminobutyrate:proton symporter (AAT family) [Lentzea atacamensis]RAS65945.1 gamma-aminobutyrate:proton symporter (AAT family) [Lentzea atacamensis]